MGRMSKIRAKVDARSSVQNKDGLKVELKDDT